MINYQGKLLIARKVINNGENNTLSTWDGSTWVHNFLGSDTLDAGNPQDYNSLCEYKGNLYVGGNIDRPDGIHEIMMYDGQRWKGVGGQIAFDGFAGVYRLLEFHGDLYVCGEFMEGLGAPGNAIARWDGEEWHRLGDGLMANRPSAMDMIVFNDEIYVTGWFHTVNGIPSPDGLTMGKGFAKWDGEKWCTLGTTGNNDFNRIGRTKTGLYAMGGFTSINGVNLQGNNIAKWIGGSYTDTCTMASGETSVNSVSVADAINPLIFPNPVVDGILQINFRHRAPTNLLCYIFDLTGKKVTSARLSGTENSIDLSNLCPGLYMISIKSADSMYRTKIVIQ
jgi:hypothetical protein